VPKLTEAASAPSRRTRLLRGLGLAGVFACAFLVRSLYAVPLAALMYTPQQPGTRMAWRYHETAVGILGGEGILWPRQPDPARTGLMARPPGYSTFIAAVYATIDRSFFATQLVQNLLTSLACVLLALAASRLLGWAVGLLGGFFVAVEPHIALPSGFLLADALSALPLMVALLLLAQAHEREQGGLWRSALAGACVGLGVWLRANVVLLAPALAAVLLVTMRPWKRGFVRGVVLSATAACVVLPITIRNWVVFHEFVPVSIAGGLTFWQGVADAGGDSVGAERRDKLVMEDEAVRYGNPRYREWWAEPDGVWRDRDRYRRAREVIAANPGLYTRVVLGRMAAMLSYHAGDAPTVASTVDEPPDRDAGAGRRQYTLSRQPSDDRYLLPGRWASPLERPIDWLQTALGHVLLPLVAIGSVVLLWFDWRRAALLLGISLYYLCTECFFIYEWRVATPMHYGLCAAAAAAIVLPLRAWRDRRAGRIGNPAD
jgi:hypothetical protein